MRMNRRNVLVGLGTIVAGGGAALGTGAFSSVEANRTANVEVEDDAAAFLALEVHSSREADSGFVQTTGTGNGDGQIEFHFDETAIGETNGGLNDDAETYFDNLVTVTNNGTNNVTIDIEHNGGGDALTAYIGSDRTDTVDGTQILTIDDSNQGTDEYGSSVDIGFKFDSIGSNNPNSIDTITFVAEESP